VTSTSLSGLFELFDFSDGNIRIFHSNNGLNFTEIPVVFDANTVFNVTISARYIKFVVTLLSEFGDAETVTPAPPPNFISLTINYSSPTRQHIFTFKEQSGTPIRELAATVNATIPETSGISLGLTHSNSTKFTDYGNISQPKIDGKGRIVVVDSSLSSLNLVADSSSGGNTSSSSKTYHEITDEFIAEQEEEFGKSIDRIVVNESKTSTSDGNTTIIFADGSESTVDDAPDYSEASDFQTIEGENPTINVTEGTVLNYNFLTTDDGIVYRSTYSAWQPGSVVNVYRNGVLINSDEYLLFQHFGIVKFHVRQRISDNYSLEVALSPEYRVGIEVVNNDSRKSVILDEFAYMYGADFVKSVDFGNDAPVATDLAITPADADPTSTFSATYTYSDGNSDPENGSQIQWFINDGVISELTDKTSWNGSDLVGKTLKDGDRIYFTVKPNDGKAFGNLAVSTKLVLGDRPPTISDLKLRFRLNGAFVDESTSSVDVIVQYTYFDSQGRAESGTQIEWLVNGNPVVFETDNPKIMPNASASSDDTFPVTRGNLIQAKVIPSNGIVQGITYETEEITIVNSLPILTNVELTPAEPTTSSVLEIVYDFFDKDGDDDVSNYDWFKNGVEVVEVVNRKTISTSFLSSGDTWYADVTPNDGTGTGDVIRTSTVTIS
jgi:hypothetical protein